MQGRLQPHIMELLRFTEGHRRHTKALARATGELFNVFEILDIGHYEVKTHSPMLGELLDPKGSHGQGAVFLRLFLEAFDIQFDAEGECADVKLEYTFRGSADGEPSGRIDIVLQDGKGSIVVIENKIYHGHRNNQVERYRTKFPRARLFYLTLFDGTPEGFSENDLQRLHCECISYAEDILSWLNKCRKEAASLPCVRETITQYIHLIEKLTNQSTSAAMNKELISKIVESKESLDAFFTLHEAAVAVQNDLICRVDAKLDAVAKAAGVDCEGSFQDRGVYFTTPGLKKCNLHIAFAFDSRSHDAFFFGFGLRDTAVDCPVGVANKIYAAFAEWFEPDKPNRTWPASAWWVEHKNWRRETFEAILSGRFEAELKEKLKKLVEIARQVCPDEAIT